MNWHSYSFLEYNTGPASRWPTLTQAAKDFDIFSAFDDVELEYWRSVHETCKGTDEH